MNRPPWTRARLAVFVLIGGVFASQTLTRTSAVAQDRAANAGQFFEPVVEPISYDAIQTLRSSALAYLEEATSKGERPILVLEFRPGQTAPGESTFGAAIDLADFIARDLGGAKETVAFVPESLSGFAVLPVLACGEIVLGPAATLGPIGKPGRPINNREREAIRELATARGRDVDLLLGLLEPDRDLRQVRTADGSTHFVMAEHLDEFRRTHQILSEKAAWEGRRGVLHPEMARQTISRLQADTRARVAQVYGLPSTATDPTLSAQPVPVLIPIRGRLDPGTESYVLRQIRTVVGDGANFIIFEINSEGGLFDAASKVADGISRLQNVRTVAYIDDRALGVSILPMLACDQIVMRKGARIGNARQEIIDASGTAVPLEERQVRLIAERAEDLAHQKGRPGAVARAMVDPATIVLHVRDKQIGVATYATQAQVDSEAGRYEVIETTKSDDGEVWTLNSETAPSLQMSDRTVRDFDELQTVLGLHGKVIRQASRTWVDSLVDTLNEPWMRGVLLFIGFFMLVLELKLPGIGLPAVLATLAFLLYFWSGYLGGTADMLEVLLFLVGIVCLGIELFVFPGLGIFGMSGIVLILVSVVMASHTFVWPTEEYEYQQLAGTIFRLLGVIVGTIVAAIVLSRFMPALPIFNRLILKPEPAGGPELSPGEKPPPDLDAPLTYLLGEVGHTTTPLRPAGKARFGDLLVDVTADGFWIGVNQPVEVIEVRGARVVVKRVSA